MPRERVAAVICKPCAAAADHVTERMTTLGPWGARLGAVSVAVMMHRGCTGCDCQHKVSLQAAGKSVAR